MPKKSRRFLAVAALLLCALTLIPLHAADAGSAGAAGAAGAIRGAEFPDVPLVTQDGKTVRFFTDLVKDKVVIVDFIYTRCPDGCALETARLRQVQRILQDRVGRDVFIYSITLDPANDTPKVLKAYADQFDVAQGWLFLTGKEADITLLRQKLGLGGADPKGDKLKGHEFRHVIGNQRTGQWLQSTPLESPYTLASRVGALLKDWKMPPQSIGSFGDEKDPRTLSRGEKIFQSRCSACHTIAVPGNWKIGPDLFGVTQRRERDWLTRWIAAPEEMIADKDWQALELFQVYNGLAMPNLKMTADDIEAVLSFIEEESRRKEQSHPHH